MRRWIALLVAFVGLGAAPSCFADLTAVFDMSLSRTTSPGINAVKGGKPEMTTTQLTLRLGRDYLVYEDADDAEFIDFHSRLVTDRIKKEGQYIESSLLSRVGFASAEFNNRLMLAGALAAGGVKDNPMDKVLTEQLFSLRAPGSVPLSGTIVGPMESWQHGDKPLFASETEGYQLTPEETQIFLRFLRYRFGLHPDIIAGCARRAIIPNRMEVYRYNMQIEHFSLRLVKAQRVADTMDHRLFLSQAVPKQDQLTTLCEKAMSLSPADFHAACAQLRAEGIKQRDAGHTFDGLLLLMEYGLCTDEQLPADIAAMKDAIQHDPDCMKLFSCLMPNSKEAAEQAIKDLQTLEAKTERGKRSLKVFRANNLGQLGHAEEAKALFIEVLTENPAHVGAWKDLGDLFYNQYEMPMAWRCWDAGRHLLPTHRNFQPVYELEKKLVQTYPEFL